MALTDRSSVTVVGPDGLSTDGLSSAVAILGPQKGLQLIEETPQHGRLHRPHDRRQADDLPIEAVAATLARRLSECRELSQQNSRELTAPGENW